MSGLGGHITKALFLSALQLTVTVLDVNDFTPKFEPQSYTKSVVEDTRALGDAEDRVILTISAKDDDEGENAKILYTIIEGNEEGQFGSVFLIV